MTTVSAPMLVAIALGVSAGAVAASQPADADAPVAIATVEARSDPARTPYEGVVEATRQTVVAAQVPGAVIALQVRAGERVRAGQVLLRIDARAADQAAAAGAAQARAGHAAMEVATREFERQQQLYAQGFISQAALDRAQAQRSSAQAEASAQVANAAAARTRSDLHVVRAPYAGVVAQVAVVLGDMAMPGRPLLTLFDPGALRVTAAVPQATLAEAMAQAQVEIPGAAPRWIRPVQVQPLPTVDPASHTLELRADLPAGTEAAPGMFARVWLGGPVAGAGAQPRLVVPVQALVRRAELVAVYVIGRDGRALLRQVRPGRVEGRLVEILSGVAAGEQVALDPQIAARTLPSAR